MPPKPKVLIDSTARQGALHCWAAHARLQLSGFTVCHHTLKEVGSKSSFFLRCDEKPSHDSLLGEIEMWAGDGPEVVPHQPCIRLCSARITRYPAMIQRLPFKTLPVWLMWVCAELPGCHAGAIPLQFLVLFVQISCHYLQGCFTDILLFIQPQSWMIFLVCNMGSGYKFSHP